MALLRRSEIEEKLNNMNSACTIDEVRAQIKDGLAKLYGVYPHNLGVPVIINPDTALWLLSASRDYVNREHNNWDTIMKYANFMERQEWFLNGSTIVLDITFIVRDGRHRLFACVASQIPFETYIIADVACSKMIDAGVRRTDADNIRIAIQDRTITKEITQVIKTFYNYHYFSLRNVEDNRIVNTNWNHLVSRGKFSWTTDDQVATYELYVHHIKQIDYYASCIKKIKTSKLKSLLSPHVIMGGTYVTLLDCMAENCIKDYFDNLIAGNINPSLKKYRDTIIDRYFDYRKKITNGGYDTNKTIEEFVKLGKIYKDIILKHTIKCKES